MRDQRDSLEPDAEAPTEFVERVMFGVGVDEDSEQEYSRVDPHIVVEVVCVLVVALDDARVQGSKVFSSEPSR